MHGEAKQAKAIFDRALEIQSATERDDLVRRECADDAELRAWVQGLLGAYEEAGSFLESPPAGLRVAATVDHSPEERAGSVVGPYKLLEPIGEGGFGVVFMAEQTEPVRRKVALKVLKPGMDTRQVVARFEAERQALAIMDHPNIAKVFDGGATDSGRPFFVMELVKGVPITDYCDQNHLTPRRRLELFVSVCQAVQHAHQKGIIHRDIKPSNVLVAVHDTAPVVKVIDFGVAKALGQELTDKTLFTGFALMIGTPLYMSPEQAGQSRLDVDTRSDIYSLGVLLYELLTGTTPFDAERFQRAVYEEIRRIIREEEPPRPSTRLSDLGKSGDATRTGAAGAASSLASVSAARHTEPAKLTRLFRGEVDWIVMKALEKDRNRRYGTANGFAADVQRYLNDEAVQACPPSVGYRFRKFARRNRAALAFTGLVLLILLTLTGGIGWNVRDRAARQTAVEQEVRLALKEAGQWQDQAKWPEALSAAKRAEGLLAGGGSDELRERVRLFRTDLDMVLRLEEFRAQRGEFFSHEPMDRAYARIFADFDMDVERLSPPELAERIRRRSGTAVRVAAALDDWAMVRRDWCLRDRTRDSATWKRLLEAARLADPDPWRGELRWLMDRGDVAALRALADRSDIATLPPQSLQLMGNALIFGGDCPACVAWLRRAHREHPGDALISFDLAFHLSELPSADSAEVLRFVEAALAVRQSPSLYYSVGFHLSRLGRYEEAIACQRKAIELKPDFAGAHSHLGYVLSKQGKLDEAIVSFRKAVELDPTNPAAHDALGHAFCDQNKLDEAITCYKKAIELKPDDAEAHFTLGSFYAQWGEWKKAGAEYDRGLELDPTNDAGWVRAATLYAADGNVEGYRRTCAQMLERFGGTVSPQTAERTAKACLLLPDALTPADADRVQKLAVRAVTGTEKHGYFGFFATARGLAEYRAGRYEAAVEWMKRSQPLAGGVHWEATKFAVLSMAHYRLGRPKEADAALASAKAIVARIPNPAKGQPLDAGIWHDWLHPKILCREAEKLLKE